MNDIIYREIKLPLRVGAFTVVDDNGDYNIYVNSQLNEEAKHRAKRHELAHITMCHFYTNKTASECEREVANA